LRDPREIGATRETLGRLDLQGPLELLALLALLELLGLLELPGPLELLALRALRGRAFRFTSIQRMALARKLMRLL